MYLYEYEAKRLFSRAGIPVPRGKVVTTATEAAAVSVQFKDRVVIKAQVQAGGRGKAGLVKIASTPHEATTVTQAILGRTFHGEQVAKVLVEEVVDIAQELYAAIALDTASGLPVILVSSRGGMDIEQVAQETPEVLVRFPLEILTTFHPFRAREIWREAGIKGEILPKLSAVLEKMVNLFFHLDAYTVEINPLVVTRENRVVAADGKLIVDDAALAKHEEELVLCRPASEGLEDEAKKAGLSYVSLDPEGNIGIIAGGAGLSLATMDTVTMLGGKPANFLDTGGGISSEKMAQALRLVLQTSTVKGIIINVFGGINNCLTMAQGISRVIDEDSPRARILVKMRGHSQEEGWALLEKRRVPVIKYGTTAEAVQLLLDLLGADRLEGEQLCRSC